MALCTCISRSKSARSRRSALIAGLVSSFLFFYALMLSDLCLHTPVSPVCWFSSAPGGRHSARGRPGYYDSTEDVAAVQGGRSATNAEVIGQEAVSDADAWQAQDEVLLPPLTHQSTSEEEQDSRTSHEENDAAQSVAFRQVVVHTGLSTASKDLFAQSIEPAELEKSYEDDDGTVPDEQPEESSEDEDKPTGAGSEVSHGDNGAVSRTDAGPVRTAVGSQSRTGTREKADCVTDFHRSSQPVVGTRLAKSKYVLLVSPPIDSSPAQTYHTTSTARHQHPEPGAQTAVTGKVATPVNRTLMLSPIPTTIGEYLQKHRIPFVSVTVQRTKSRQTLQRVADRLKLGQVASIIFNELHALCASAGRACRSLLRLPQQHSVGAVYIIGDGADKASVLPSDALPLTVMSPTRIKAVQPSATSPVHYIMRKNAREWTLPFPLSTTEFTSLEHSGGADHCTPLLTGTSPDDIPVMLAASCSHDTDRRRSVVFGGSAMSSWMMRLMLLDSLRYASHGELHLDLLRRVQIDIDDVFLGHFGSKPSSDDMKELLRSQERLQCLVPGFKYYLGYVGGAFQSSPIESENAGDRFVLDNAERFAWFPHTYNHTKAHLMTYDKLKSSLLRNKDFAKKHGISVDSGYAVSPHHSGIYPTHRPLYMTWREVWNITVSSTEEYLHLKPAFRRRGFRYMGIRVLPRQTCGLFSHTLTRSTFPGGAERLFSLPNGGELFQTLVDNPISIFMSHYVNYGGEKLAIGLFESLFEFVTRYTNLELSSVAPTQLAKEYFDLNPGEEDPLWQDPCSEVRLYNGWMSSGKKCYTLPTVLMTGDDRDLSTSLYTKLTTHPQVFGASQPTSGQGSRSLPPDFAFLSSESFLQGVDWYMSKFPSLRPQTEPSNTATSSRLSTPPHIIDVSMSYLQSDKAPLRAWRLIPHAHLIMAFSDLETTMLLPCKVTLLQTGQYVTFLQLKHRPFATKPYLPYY
eukprot:scpid24542/ scgid2276/ Bifunctional heparan sulfate N-deacetylase/N-sulfotransferase; Glucosaminyl N-deacetylase/N-sulfotransferase; Sulfateless; Heparan sulfate N-deacetylase; Heparan sulfate N-sulfotransferase